MLPATRSIPSRILGRRTSGPSSSAAATTVARMKAQASSSSFTVLASSIEHSRLTDGIFVPDHMPLIFVTENLVMSQFIQQKVETVTSEAFSPGETLLEPQVQYPAAPRALSLRDLVQNEPLLVFPTASEKEFHFDWQERSITKQEFQSVVLKLLQSFNESNRSGNFRFPLLRTGKGMGKTRFAYEAAKMVEEILAPEGSFFHGKIFIDFNGDDKITNEDIECGAAHAMAIRLLARGVFGTSVKDFRNSLSRWDFSLDKRISTNEVLRLFVSRLKSTSSQSSSDPTSIFIHLDEVQHIEEIHQKSFFKHMMYELANFPSKEQNAFLIPLITSTSRPSLPAKFCLSQLPMDPFSLQTSLSLLEQEFGPSPLLTFETFGKLVRELGVIPGYLELLCTVISGNTEKWRDPGDLDALTATYATELLKQLRVDQFVELLGPDTNRFLLYPFTCRPLYWNKPTFNNHPLSQLASTGNIFLRNTEMVKIWFPGVLMHLLANHSGDRLFRKLTAFPPVQKIWDELGPLTMALVTIRNNLLLSQGLKTATLDLLFPGAIGSVGTTLQLSKLEWVKELSSTPNGHIRCLDIDDQVIEDVSWLNGNYSVLSSCFTNARVVFLNYPTPVILMLQFRSTNSENTASTLSIEELREIEQQTGKIAENYPNHKFIFGLITDQLVDSQYYHEISKWDKFLMVSQEQLPDFATNFHYRFN